MNWTQEKPEDLYNKVNDRAAKDPVYYEKVLKNPKAAMEEMDGCPLPDDMGLKYIEKDNNFGGTYVVPDFAEGEIDLSEMKTAVGGTSDSGTECGADYSVIDVCGAEVSVIGNDMIASVCQAETSIL